LVLPAHLRADRGLVAGDLHSADLAFAPVCGFPDQRFLGVAAIVRMRDVGRDQLHMRLVDPKPGDRRVESCVQGHIVTRAGLPDYRLMLMMSASISSAVVITRVLAEKARCVTIILENRSAMSTLEPSSALPRMVPAPLSPALPMRTAPLSKVSVKPCATSRCRALGPLTWARAPRKTMRLRRLSYCSSTSPLSRMRTSFSRPCGRPSWVRRDTSMLSPANWVMPLVGWNWPRVRSMN